MPEDRRQGDRRKLPKKDDHKHGLKEHKNLIIGGAIVAGVIVLYIWHRNQAANSATATGLTGGGTSSPTTVTSISSASAGPTGARGKKATRHRGSITARGHGQPTVIPPQEQRALSMHPGKAGIGGSTSTSRVAYQTNQRSIPVQMDMQRISYLERTAASRRKVKHPVHKPTY